MLQGCICVHLTLLMAQSTVRIIFYRRRVQLLTMPPPSISFFASKEGGLILWFGCYLKDEPRNLIFTVAPPYPLIILFTV